VELTIRGTSHPYYGAEAYGENGIVEMEDLDELISTANDYDEDLNFVYRWDWHVPSESEIADAEEDGEEPLRETLTLFVVLQRKSRFANWVCPVGPDDEARVREFLTSDRILGALRRTWAPILDVEA